MDLADIQRKALAAREFNHTVAHVTFTLRVPTPHEAECAAVRVGFHGPGSGDEATVRFKRAMLEAAIVGWAGAKVADVLAPEQAGSEAAADFGFEADAVPLLLDANPEWAGELWPALLARIEARNALREAAAKNSPRAPSGSDPDPTRAGSPNPAST